MTPKKKGLFITLEGIEGSGKTTQIPGLRAFFNEYGHSCLVTREPGGTKIGAKIRRILLDPAHKNMASNCELLLYFADRAQHLQEVVAPALQAGQIVICDRFFDATLVYQGYARGLDRRMILDLHRLVFDGLLPDITLLLDLAPAQGLARAWSQINNGGRTEAESRFEAEKLQFHEKVRAGYLDIARRDPERFHIIDATQPAADVGRQMYTILKHHLD